MNVIRFSKRYACLVSAVLLLVGQASIVSAQQEWLVDFGNNATQYRGIPVPSPDLNGHYWNSIQPGLLVPNMVDTHNTTTTLQLGWDTPVGTDSYNGPAGDTSFGTPADNVGFTQINAAALGDLGVNEAAFDFAAGPSLADNRVQFEIQNLDPAKKYDLTFFGSHKYSLDATTVYSVYSDSSFATQVASTMLNVMDPTNPFNHNQDKVATIMGVSPQTDNILFLQFVGMTGHEGYLNSMEIVAEAAAPGVIGDYNNNGKVDAADYVVWRSNVGTTNVLPNDPAGGMIGATQYNNWRSHFGTSAGSGSGLVGSAVPEPSSVMLVLGAVMGLFSFKRNR
ncbi:MAG TPA: PEP-CTERM sorting domain-containing protein [Lacipirellulaceae bacterium]|jgi:hypothetical protein|nr:PEP-CTERM sorting domain-containing protein [Lacipirellulaceae bacterium]